MKPATTKIGCKCYQEGNIPKNLAKEHDQGQKYVTSEFGVSNPESNNFTDYSRTCTASCFFHRYQLKHRDE